MTIMGPETGKCKSDSRANVHYRHVVHQCDRATPPA